MAESMTTQVDRQFPRLSRQGKVDFKEIENPQEDLIRVGVPESQFQNISGGGIRFRTRASIQPGTFLAVRIDLPDLPDSIIAMGRVVSCDPPSPEEQHPELSVEFFWTGWGEPSVESNIHRYIRERV